MPRENNAAITFRDAQYMEDHEGFTAKQTIPTWDEAMTKQAIINYLYVKEDELSGFANNQLVPYQYIQPGGKLLWRPIQPYCIVDDSEPEAPTIRYVIASYEGVYASEDLISWSEVLGFNDIGWARNVKYMDGQWVALGYHSDIGAKAKRSTDGVNWFDMNLPRTDAVPADIAYNGSEFMMIYGTPSGVNAWKSTDLQSWTGQGLPNPMGSSSVMEPNKIRTVGSSFYIVGSGNSAFVYQAGSYGTWFNAGFSGWDLHAIATDGSINGTVLGGDKLGDGYSDESSIIRISTDWQQSHLNDLMYNVYDGVYHDGDYYFIGMKSSTSGASREGNYAILIKSSTPQIGSYWNRIVLPGQVENESYLSAANSIISTNEGLYIIGDDYENWSEGTILNYNNGIWTKYGQNAPFRTAVTMAVKQ